MIHKMRLDDAPFSLIKSGAKDVEMRLYDEKRREVKVGDVIEFANNSSGDTLVARVDALHICSSFYELYDRFDKLRLGYLPSEEAHPADMEKYYTPENILRYGVVGIQISLV